MDKMRQFRSETDKALSYNYPKPNRITSRLSQKCYEDMRSLGAIIPGGCAPLPGVARTISPNHLHPTFSLMKICKFRAPRDSFTLILLQGDSTFLHWSCFTFLTNFCLYCLQDLKIKEFWHNMLLFIRYLNIECLQLVILYLWETVRLPLNL